MAVYGWSNIATNGARGALTMGANGSGASATAASRIEFDGGVAHENMT